MKSWKTHFEIGRETRHVSRTRGSHTHEYGVPLCETFSFYPENIFTTPNKEKVDCKRCLNILDKRAAEALKEGK